MKKTYRYEATLITTIGASYRLVEESKVFDAKRDAVAYATAGLERFGVQVVRVQRLVQVEQVVLLRWTPQGTELVWQDDGQVFERSRYANKAEVDRWNADGCPNIPTWALQ